LPCAPLRRLARAASASPSAPAGKVIEGPVEGLEDNLELILLQEVSFRREQPGLDERQDRALDRASLREDRGGMAGVRFDEILLTPREDRADADLVLAAVDLDALGATDALLGSFLELSFESIGREGLAAQPAAANCATSQRQKEARILEAGQYGLLDLIQRHRATADFMCEPLERAGNLADAVSR